MKRSNKSSLHYIQTLDFLPSNTYTIYWKYKAHAEYKYISADKSYIKWVRKN
jgi:hypothetical protein